jgi:sugar phosphate isomerase/epimerase
MNTVNGRWPVSATQWIFGSETIETTVDRLARLGYDGIELSGEPQVYTADAVRAVIEPRGLRVTSICGIYTRDRDLSHPSKEIREAGVRYVGSCAELASALGASVVIVVPTAVGRIAPEADATAERRWAGESIREAAGYAEQVGVRLVIEALNRYESYLINRLEASAQLAADVSRPNVGLMADLFHMNIEEVSLTDGISSVRDLVWHVHLADSNRRAPGLGHTDFRAVVDTLDAIGYSGALTMEFLPPTSNPYLAASLDVPEAAKTADSAQGITYIRSVLEDL